jgi:hypothetical protein
MFPRDVTVTGWWTFVSRQRFLFVRGKTGRGEILFIPVYVYVQRRSLYEIVPRIHQTAIPKTVIRDESSPNKPTSSFNLADFLGASALLAVWPTLKARITT